MNNYRRKIRNFLYENFLHKKRFSLTLIEKKYVQLLFRQGFCVIENYWSPEKSAEYKEKIDKLVLGDENNSELNSGAYVRWNKFKKHQAEDCGVVRAYHIEKEIAELQKLKNDPSINNIINAYYGYKMYSSYLVYQHNKVSDHETRGYHIDGFTDEFKSFLYLEDVDEMKGPFSYLSGSHKSYLKREKRKASATNPSTAFSESELIKEMKKECKLTAKAGSLILADTVGFHRGLPQRSESRSIIYNNYFPKKVVLYPEK